MTRRRLLLIGEDFGNAPEQYVREIYTLTGYSGRRLAALMGFAGDQAMFEYALTTERVNVVERQPQWKDQPLVASRVLELQERMRDRHVILLGNRVAKAFRVDRAPMLEWLRVESPHPGSQAIRVARVPHPSGRSHWWNDRRNVEVAGEFLREAMTALR